MPSGLVALLDDVAAITKLAAASLDDISAAAGKAGTKAAGVVIDDAAVTPRYVTGFEPDRELPIIWRIAKGSLRNKMLILLPVAIALSALAPWAITPLLMLGGAFLCYEAAEKILHALQPHASDEPIHDPTLDPKDVEDEKVAGAVRTDLILSAEIMAIALSDISDKPLATQAAVLAAVGLAITIGVYGVVAIIVKTDDVGLHLAQRGSALVRAVGRGLVLGMPVLLSALSTIGTAAMAWVGGGIIIHGMEEFGFDTLPHLVHDAAEAAGAALSFAGAAVTWFVGAALAGVFGVAVGAVIVAILKKVMPAGKAH